jgi:hypothetical protein
MGQNRELSRFPNAITVLDNGNVGIGTTSFSEGTQPTGTISIIPNSSVSSGPLVQFAGNGRIRPASTGDRLSIDGNALFLNSTFNANIVMATGGGNVLIGTTTSDTGRLQIQASTTGTSYGHSLLLTDSSTSKNAFLISHRDGETRLMSTWGGSGIDSNMSFWTTRSNGTQAERMRLTTAGRLELKTEGIVLQQGASNTVGGGSFVALTQTAGGGGERWILQQLNTSYGMDYWAYNGSSWSVISTISNTGVITTPGRPAFRVYNSVNGFWYVNNNDTLIFDATEYNIGGHYNTSNGRFTAPVAGVYQFNFYTIVYGNLQNGAISLRKNGGAPTSGHNIHFSPYYTSVSWSNVVYTTSLYLNAGDYIFLINSTGVQIPIHGDDWSSFSGYLVG